MEDGRQASFLFLPEGQDPDDAVRSGGREAFEQLMAEAVPLEDFLFESTSRNLDLNSLEGRARMSKQALPYIRQLPEGVFRQLMYQSLAERTGLELTSLMQLEVPPMDAELAQDASIDGAESPPPYLDEVPLPEAEHSGAPPPSFRHRPTPEGYSSLVQTAIALLLHQPNMARLISPEQLEGLDFEGSQLLLDLLQLLQRRPESSTAMLLGHWYGTPEGNLLNRLAGQERLIPATGIEQEFTDTLLALTHLPGQNKLAAQVDKLKVTNYADVSDTEKQRLKELLQEKLARDAQRNKPAD